MIRLTPRPRIHVPNHLAMLAAVVLAVTSFSGIYASKTLESETAANTTANVTQQANDQQDAADTLKRKSKLSLGLLLFGKG